MADREASSAARRSAHPGDPGGTAAAGEAVGTGTAPGEATDVGGGGGRRGALDGGILTLLDDRCGRLPHTPLYEVRTAAGWRSVSAMDFAAQVAAVGLGLIARGVEAGDSVAILVSTRYEWGLLDFAVVSVGAVTVPIYETSSDEQVA